MRYEMKQKIWSWADNFIVKDEAGVDRFIIRGKAFSFGDKLSFCDTAGRELVFIQEKVFSWGPTYELHHASTGQPTVVKKRWTFFKDRFTVDMTADGPTADDLEIAGDFWDHEYQFVRAGQPIAGVSKRWFTWADTYGVDIAAGEDDVLILACTVVVDLCIAKRSRHSSN